MKCEKCSHIYEAVKYNLIDDKKYDICNKKFFVIIEYDTYQCPKCNYLYKCKQIIAEVQEVNEKENEFLFKIQWDRKYLKYIPRLIYRLQQLEV